MKKEFPTLFIRAFTLIEVMVVVTLLSLIVLALMAVFDSTQRAFRASATQADVLQGGRAVMDLISQDLKTMSPSDGVSNNPTIVFPDAVNFYAGINNNYPPLIQPLIASSNERTNVLENFFILSSGNQNGVPTWYGTGYAVYLSPTNLYSLYRFSTSHPMAVAGAVSNMFRFEFENFISAPSTYTNSSHLIDGVIGLRVRAYDLNGVWMTNGYGFNQTVPIKNVLFLPSTFGEVGFYMFSNSLPASVEVEIATLEDRTLQRAESFGSLQGMTNYLAWQGGKVHVFRQRISIPNVDPSAYQ